MRQIITIATLKGGSGKSTLASCLAVHWQLQGRRPVIVDADPQRSIARLASRERALGGVRVVEDTTENAWQTARDLATTGQPVIIDTPGFKSPATLACTAAADFLLIPVKASPLDVDRMLDTVQGLLAGSGNEARIFRCVLTQTTRDSVISKHVRAELLDAGLPLLRHELTSRVAFPEAALYGGTPNLLQQRGPAARDIAAIAGEVDELCGFKLAAVA